MKLKLFLCFRCGRRFDEKHIGHVDDHIEICNMCHDETNLLTKNHVENRRDYAINQ